MVSAFMMATVQMSERAVNNVEELLRLDAEDESLRRYKETLLGAAAQGDLGGPLSRTVPPSFDSRS